MTAEDLIAAIVAAPEDESAWLAYGDWLLDRGDPRGELITLATVDSAEARQRVRAIESKGEDELVSSALRKQLRHWRLDWERGFVTKAELNESVERPTADAFEALLADPHVALLRRLRLELRGEAPGSLASGEVSEVLERSMPRVRWLEHLVLRATRVERLENDRLRTLVAGTPSVRELATPALEQLSWELDDNDAVFADVRSPFVRPPPRVRVLGLRNASATTIGHVAVCPLLRQLHTLSLGHDPVDIDMLNALIEHAPAFAHLERVVTAPCDVPAADLPGMQQRLEAALPRSAIRLVGMPTMNFEVAEQPHNAPPVPAVDETSRRADGSIDAIAFFHRPPKS